MDSDTAAQETRQTSHAALAKGYRQMARDRERETEAEEWAEALIGDVASDAVSYTHLYRVLHWNIYTIA